jgi:hypothetical protein
MTLGASKGIAAQQRVTRTLHKINEHAVARGRAHVDTQARDSSKELVIAREAAAKELIVGCGNFSGNVHGQGTPAGTQGIIARHARDVRQEDLVSQAVGLQSVQVSSQSSTELFMVILEKPGEPTLK